MIQTSKRSAYSETAATRRPTAPEGHETPPLDSAAVQARIAERAYELYLQRGEKHGSAMDDWLQAEQEIMGGESIRGR
jgi:hypothetical protein